MSEAQQRYGRYSILARIAAGGMGEVYLARAEGAAGVSQQVVVKRLLPHLVEQERFTESLVEEARLLVELNHPNIVRMIDFGVEGNDYYLVMEFVRGYNLATVIHYCAKQDVVIPAPACAAIGLGVLEALTHAHDRVDPDGAPQSIVHRDISPQNVLIDEDGWVKVTDFGIAKVVGQAGEMTNLKGKLRYIAPEVLEEGRIDPRYDLYSVGILMFESLCRRNLIAGKVDAEILAEVRRVEVPRIQDYHKGVPEPLVDVVERALQKDPDRRYQSAVEFSRDLRRAMRPMDEAEARQVLKGLVGALYSRDDFPLDRAKLPDVEGVTASRSIELVQPGVLRAARGGRRRGVTLAAGLFLAMAASVAGYLLLSSTTDPRPPRRAEVDMNVLIIGPGADARTPLPDLSRLCPATPGPLAVEMFDAVFNRRGAALESCYRRHGGRGVLTVDTTVLRNGSVADVVIRPARWRGTALGRCVDRVVRGMVFPCHADAAKEFSKRITPRR